MAIAQDSLKGVIEPGIKSFGAPDHFWRKLAPARPLILVALFHLAFSLSYILIFARAFHLGRRVAVLHIVVILDLILLTTLCMGSLLLFRRIRDGRLTRFVFALIAATGLSTLIVLYFVNYVGNSLWGNNVNYELVAQYLMGGGIFQKELQLLPRSAYFLLAAGIVTVFSVYLAFSGPLFRSLSEIFSPDGSLSLFRSPSRTLKSAAMISLALLASGYIGVMAIQVESPYRDRILLHEPIIGLFVNPNALSDFVSYSTRAELEAAEDRIRANYPSGQSFSKRNVVMIMVDSLRPDHMEIYGYERPTTPFLTSLLKTGNLKKVETAMSTCPDTTCGVMGTLSSKTLKKQIPQSFKLSDLLYGQGYKVHFILSGSHRWYRLKEFYGTNFTTYFDGTNSSKYEWTDDRIIIEGLEKLPAFSGDPAFFYFHLMSTHVAGIRQEEYRTYNPTQNWIESETRKLNPSSVTNYYDNGVVQADATIRLIFESLKQKGYLDQSLVVILSDHGEALGQRDPAFYGHVHYLYQECIRIPLLFYEDTAANYSSLQYATQIDIAPTILGRLGLTIPPNWQGRSLLGPDLSDYSFHQTRNYPPSYAVVYRTGGTIYKYLVHPGRGEELYELASDPHEKYNLMDRVDPGIIKQMRGKLDDYIR